MSKACSCCVSLKLDVCVPGYACRGDASGRVCIHMWEGVNIWMYVYV